MKATPRPLHVLLAAPPDAPGVEPTLVGLEGVAAAGTPAHLLVTEGGLLLLPTPWPARLAAAGVRLSMCARSARLRKVDPLKVPHRVAWSSLTSFVRDLPEDARLWVLFP